MSYGRRSPPNIRGDGSGGSKTGYDTITERVEQTETGYSVTIQSTRGTEVRDSDDVRLTAHYDDLNELEVDKDRLCGAVESIMDARRSHQPDREGDSGARE